MLYLWISANKPLVLFPAFVDLVHNLLMHDDVSKILLKSVQVTAIAPLFKGSCIMPSELWIRLLSSDAFSKMSGCLINAFTFLVMYHFHLRNQKVASRRKARHINDNSLSVHQSYTFWYLAQKEGVWALNTAPSSWGMVMLPRPMCFHNCLILIPVRSGKIGQNMMITWAEIWLLSVDCVRCQLWADVPLFHQFYTFKFRYTEYTDHFYV